LFQITKFTKPQIILGRSLSQDECTKLDCLHGRFGFSLANAGDLNKDGFDGNTLKYYTKP